LLDSLLQERNLELVHPVPIKTLDPSCVESELVG